MFKRWGGKCGSIICGNICQGNENALLCGIWPSREWFGRQKKYLDEEVTRASTSGSGLVLHFDGNLWAGPNIIPGDPTQQNRNGKMLEEFLSRNPQLTVVNALPLCQGLITRRSLREGHLPESVFRFFTVCDRFLPYSTSMLIDENKKYVLTNFEQVRKGGKASDTDHATQVMDVKLTLMPQKPIRRELFNFKDIAAQQRFKNLTSKTKDFTSCFVDKLPLMKQIDNWRKVLKSSFRKSFKKIRIKNQLKIKPLNPTISKLIDQRNLLLKKKEDSKKVAELNKE